MGCFGSKSKVSPPKSDGSFKGPSKEVNPARITREHSVSNFQKETKILSESETICDIYEIQEELSALPYGRIRKCVHRATGLVRAVKIVRYPKENSHINEKSVQREVRALSKLDHPNILRTYDIIGDQKRFYIIMEYWEGGLLIEKIRELQNLTHAQVCSIAKQLLSAIAYAHEMKVIHRDLSPNSICLMQKGNDLSIKILNFGVSAFVDLGREFENTLGASYYTAPEVEDEFYNEKCDEWSIGVILFLLLTGNPPFSGKNNSEIKQSIKNTCINHDFLAQKNIPEGAIDLLQKLLNKDFFTRISAAEALRHPWLSEELNNKDLTILRPCFDNLMSFCETSKLKDAVQTFIVSQIVCHSDIKSLNDAFREMDENNDGKISQDELIKYYSIVTGGCQAREMAMKIMKNVDTDHNGFIEYTEFLRASAMSDMVCSKKHLEAAFVMLDKDHSGKISVNDLQEMLNSSGLNQDKSWEEILHEADQNGDGEIDIKEFRDLLLKKL